MQKKLISCTLLSLSFATSYNDVFSSNIKADTLEKKRQNHRIHLAKIARLTTATFNKQFPANQKQQCCPIGPTLTLMKLFLADDFEYLPGGMKANIINFWTRPDMQLNHAMGEQKIDVTDRFVEIIHDLIYSERDEYQSGNAVLYHGLSGDLLFIYKYFSAIFSRLSRQNLGEFILRFNHFYAFESKDDLNSSDPSSKIFKTISEVRYACDYNESTGDYGSEKELRFLHTNIALSAQPTTSQTTASAPGFMCNSFNARVPHSLFETFITRELVLRGMSFEEAALCAQETKDLFYKFFMVPHQRKNGGMLAISVPRKRLDELTLNVWSSGASAEPSSMNDVLNNLEKALDVHLSQLSDIRDLTNETILYLDPLTQFQIRGIFMYPPKSQATFDREFSRLIHKHLSRLQKRKFRPIFNNFLIHAPDTNAENLKKLPYSAYAIPVLIDLGLVKQALELLQKNPTLKQELKDEQLKKLMIKKIIKRSYENDFLEALDLLKKLYEKPLFRLVDPEETQIIFDVLLEDMQYCENVLSVLLPLIIDIPNLSQQKQFVKRALKARSKFCGSEKLFSDSEKLGLTFDPATADGQRNIKMIKDDDSLFDMVFPLVCKYYEYYSAHKKDLKKLSLFLAKNYLCKEAYQPIFSKLSTKGYVLELGKLVCTVPFKALDAVCVFDDNYSMWVQFLQTKHPNRVYSKEIIDAYLDLCKSYSSASFDEKYCYGPVTKFSNEVSKSHTWLQRTKNVINQIQRHREKYDIEKIKSIMRARINNLDNLDILFSNIEIFDEIFGTTEATNSFISEIFGIYKEQHAKFIEILKTSQITAENAEKIGNTIPLSSLYFIINEFNEVNRNLLMKNIEILKAGLLRIWNYNHAFCPHDAIGAIKNFSDFINSCYEQNPNLIKNVRLALFLFMQDVIPSCFTKKDVFNNFVKSLKPNEMNEFIKLGLRGELGDLFEKFAVDIINELRYNDTEIPLWKGLKLLENYGGLEAEEQSRLEKMKELLEI